MRVFVVGLLAVALAGCGGGQPVVLVPTDLDGEVHAVVLDELPADFELCEPGTSFDAGPEPEQITQTPWVTTLVLTGVRNEASLTFVCDYDHDGTLVHTDGLTSTGTDRPAGNDYATRVGAVIGRVDIGVPEDAVEARYAIGGAEVVYPVEGLRLLRLHGLSGGSVEEGFEMGEVTFLDADGTDVTPESVPIPDVIHGVPRDRDNGAEVPAAGGPDVPADD